MRSFKAATMLTLAVSLTILISGCGGGGKKSSDFGNPYDPAAAYTGKTTQAVVTSLNANELGTNAYAGTGVAGTAGSSITLKTAGQAKTALSATGRPLLPVLEVIKQSTRRMNVPARAAERAKAARASRSAKSVPRTAVYQIAGDNGGVADVSMEINDTLGIFSGTVTYRDYSSSGTTMTGTAAIAGTLDAARQSLSRFTLSFRGLSITGNGYSYKLVGTLSWAYNYNSEAASDSFTMNLVVVNGSDTHWYRNYEILNSYLPSVTNTTITGRYYSTKHGYVEISTPMSLSTPAGNSLPTLGIMQLQGAAPGAGVGNTRISVLFSAGSRAFRADTDGDGADDFINVVQNPVPPAPAVNEPPVADAGMDLGVTQGNTVHLSGLASYDPDGDVLSYSWAFDSWPGDASPALANSGTAAPSFIAASAGAYTLRLTVFDGKGGSATDTMVVNASPLTTPTPTPVSAVNGTWQYSIFGTNIGRAGLLTADLAHDGGAPEIIASASLLGFAPNTFWYVAGRALDGTYQQLWQSEKYSSIMVRLLLADMNGDGKDDVVVGLEDGTVRIYDGPTLTELTGLKTAPGMADLVVADIDGDGVKEVVTTDGIGVFVYSGQTGARKWSLPSAGGSSIAIGNVDADGALEIVTTSYGGKGYVIDGASHAIEWEYLNGFGARVALGDIDSDGMQEIVGASGWYKITIYNADRRSPEWEYLTDLDIDALLVTDTDGDGIPEIVYGDRQGGKIHVVDARSRTQRLSINNTDAGVSGIAIADVDLDGRREIVWGAGGWTTGADHLYVADLSSGLTEWQSMDIYGLTPVAVGDLDNDGNAEILMVTRESNSSYDEGVVHIFDARSHTLKFRKRLGIMDWMGVRSVAIGDVDGDGRNEYIITTANIYHGIIQVYDGETHALKRQSAGYDGNFFTAVAIGDVDGDGKVEIVAGQGREHTGASGVYLIVFDGATMQEKWRSVDVGTWAGISDLKLADLDGDGHTDIVVATGSQLMVYDGVNHDQKVLIAEPARSLAVADVDGDGKLEVLVGRDDGKIDVFNGQTFAVKKTVAVSGSAIEALKVADTDGDGIAEWVVASGGAVTVLRGQGDSVVWRVGSLGSNLGLQNQMAVGDINGDGKTEIVVGSDAMLYEFRLQQSRPL